MHAISARLTTLCGCVRFVSIAAPAPSEHLVQIGVTLRLAGGVDDNPTVAEVPQYRRFRLRGFAPVDAPVEADYEEVPE